MWVGWIQAVAGVNWGLLSVAGLLLAGGVLVVLFHWKQRKRQRRIQELREHRSHDDDSSARDNRPEAEVDRRDYDAALRSGDFATAAVVARKLHSPRLYAEALERAGDIERAVSAWVDLNEFRRAAAILVEAGRPDKAGFLFEQSGAHTEALECFLKAELPMDAARSYRALGDERQANLMEGEALCMQEEHLEAARRFVAADELVRAAEMLMKAGDLPKAVEALRRAGKADQAGALFEAKGEHLSAALLFSEGGQHLRAADCYERLEDIDKQMTALVKGGAYYKAGRMAFERGELERARTYLESLGPLDEHYHDASLFRGNVYEREGKLQEAASAYTVFLEHRVPDDRTKILFLRTARIKEGVGQLQEALALIARVVTSSVGTADVTQWAARLEDALRLQVDDEAAKPSETDALAEESGVQSLTRVGIGRRSVLPDAVAQDEVELPALQVLERRYRFGQKIGQGGNGVVYKATDRALDRRVVVKFLHQGLLPTDVARKYFKREAKTAASLNHPNIVTVFDIGEEAETLFFSMEWVQGQTLADLIVDNGGKLSHEQALPLVQQLCSALTYAHETQVIHRDIKPGNVMVTESGQVKLLDFGLAKALDENPDKSVFLCGTPFYMSPEQIRREFLDHRTDIYSLGCLLYVIYTGDVPFPDGNVFAHHQTTPPPDPRERDPSIPARVAAALLATVAKDRADRPQRALDVARALAVEE